jgi:hypothetical protein
MSDETPLSIIPGTSWDTDEEDNGWKQHLYRVQLQSTGRIEQVEAKVEDINKALKALQGAISLVWVNVQPTTPYVKRFVVSKPLTKYILSFNVNNTMVPVQVVSENTGCLTATSIPQRIGQLHDLKEVIDNLEENFEDIANRIVMCEVLESKLGELEDSLEDEDAENMAWCISLVRNVLAYNYAEDLTIEHFGLIQYTLLGKVIGKQKECTKEDYVEVHKRFVESGLALLPNTKKAIDQYGK